MEVDFQLVHTHMHRQNTVDRAIRTWKNHFVAGMGSTDKLIPLHLWYRLLHQAWITLEPVRPSRRNPLISAYASVKGNFDYYRTPLAPPDTKVLVQKIPNSKDCGIRMGLRGGTSAHLLTTIVNTGCTYPKQGRKGSRTQSNSSPSTQKFQGY